MEKGTDYYLGLKYTYCFIQDESGSWFVYVKELDGCMSQGDTLEEAYAMIRDAMESWIAVELEDGAYIPEPDTSGSVW